MDGREGQNKKLVLHRGGRAAITSGEKGVEWSHVVRGAREINHFSTGILNINEGIQM